MWQRSSSWRRALCGGLLTACAGRTTREGTAPPSVPSASATTHEVSATTHEASATTHEASATSVDVRPAAAIAASPVAPPSCTPANWSARELGLLLRPRLPSNAGKARRARERADRIGSEQVLFAAECTDSPAPMIAAVPSPMVLDGVELRVVNVQPAGNSGRGWPGNQCVFELRLADGSGVAVRLDEHRVPPFTTVNALVRAGSAVWLALSFNGYASEFPRGGNRVVALDLCEGRVVWQSPDATSNGGLLLLSDYLIAPYGFTRERRYVHVLDARSGKVVQKLPVVENVCPSESWAPNWHPGDSCDAPGQAVGAATNPRVKDGLLLVDTNTGSAAFEFAEASR